MNCQSCGAKNEAEASFCAECGAPLESQVGGAQPLEDDDDRTILSMPSQIAEEAKTVAVTQEEVAEAEAEAAAPVEPEPDLPPPPDSPASGSGGGGGGLFTQRNIIIVVVVLIVLCCCCFALSVGIGASGVFDEIQRELGSLPCYLYFV